MGAHEATRRMRIGAQQQMSELMRHGMTKNHRGRRMGFFLELLDWLVEQIGVATLTILC